MFPIHGYIFVSLLLPVIFAADAANAHREFFTTVVELTNSSVFRLLCANSFIAFNILLWIFSRKIFFGKLNNSENEAVRRSIPVYLPEGLVAPFYFNVSALSSVGATSIITVVVRLLHKLAEERGTTLHTVENRSERIRMLRGMTYFFFVFVPIDLYMVFDTLSSTTWSPKDDSGFRYMTAMLYMQFAIGNVQCIVRLFLTEVGGESGFTSLGFYVETVFTLLKSVVFFVSFAYVGVVSQVPLPLVRLLFRYIVLFTERLHRFFHYHKLTRFLNTIQNAREEDLLREPRCAICYDDMKPHQACKLLPCEHCYHEACLRRWFETKSSCPYCRADLLVQMRRNTAPPFPPAVGAARVEEPGEEEVRRAYEAYRARSQTEQQHANERAVPPARPMHSGGDSAMSPLRPSASSPKRGAAPASGGWAKAEEREGVSVGAESPTISRGTLQMTRKERELAAYREYETAVRNASERLRRQLQSIEAMRE